MKCNDYETQERRVQDSKYSHNWSNKRDECGLLVCAGGRFVVH
jgi:hypothetical protein